MLDEKDLQAIAQLIAPIQKSVAAIQEELTEVHDIATKVAVTQEGIVLPRLDLLAEGHTHLADTLAPKSRVEALEEELAFMKSAFRLLSQEVAELKKAQ